MEIILSLAALVVLVVVIVQLKFMSSTLQVMQMDIKLIQEKLFRLRNDSPLTISPLPSPREVPVSPIVSAPPVPVPATIPPPVPPPLPPVLPESSTRSVPWVSEDTIAEAVKNAPVAQVHRPVTEVPAEMPAWIRATQEALRRIWNWLLVNEEHRPAGVSMEFAVATTWLIRAGIIAFVVGIGYFLKWSIDRQLFPPIARVASSLLVGVAMMVGGFVVYRRQWTILGQGLLGGAFAVLYFSLYAAGPLYHLIDTPYVFGLMILVTLTAGVMAVSCNSMLVAILGIIGGYGTPVMLSTGQPQFFAFFSYLLLLGVGVLGIAHYRAWRLLNYLAFLFTYALYAASLGQYQAVRDFNVVLVFLVLFFALHSFLSWWHSLRRVDERAGLLDILHLILNAGLFALSAYDLIQGRWGRPYPALMTLGLAIFYIAHVVWFLARPRPDRPLTLTVMALAGCFAILTLPLAVEQESLTLCWALMAAMLVWLGHRLQNRFMRLLGHGLLAVSLLRLVSLDLGRNYLWHSPVGGTFQEYRNGLMHRVWTFGGVLIAVFSSFWLERKARNDEQSQQTANNDLPVTVPPSLAGMILFWILCAVLVMFLQFELGCLSRFCLPARPALLTGVWCGMGVYLMSRYRTEGSLSFRWVGLILLIAALAKTIVFDFESWQLIDSVFRPSSYSAMLVAWRWLDLLLILGSIGWVWTWLRSADAGDVLVYWLGYGGLLLLFGFTTLEVNSCLYWVLPGFRSGGVSVYWTLFALALLTTGIIRNSRCMRYVGLGLFILVIAKVFMSDLSHMAGIYRIMASMGVGVLLILGSLVYLRAHRKFLRVDGAGDESEEAR
jgi:hypothetical protein